MNSNTIVTSGSFIAVVQRHQLAVFVLLAYAISWWPWIWYQYDPIMVDAPILPIGPFLAALVVLPIVSGWSGLRSWLGKIMNWRVGWRWYVFVLAFPSAIALAAVCLNLLLGAQQVQSFKAPDVGTIAFRFAFIFLWIGLGEEPAWRGFALPRLLKNRTALAAAVILGLIHMVWHAPLYGVEYDAANVLPWGITVFCVSIVICWIYLNTNGSLLLPMLLHASNNTIALVWKMFEGGDQLQLWWLWCALWVTATAILVFSTGLSLTRERSSSSTHSRQYQSNL
jgi:uncharacterized protein